MKPFAHTAAVVGSRFLLLVFLLLVALAQPARAQVPNIPQFGCGNENETPCPLEKIALPTGQDAILNGSCDTGLQPSLQQCGGCQIFLPFFGCVLHQLCFRCTNLSRRLSSADPFQAAWHDWALKNQRELAQDEPLNWVTQIATHNSYNTFADGHDLIDFPNQIYSTTDQLRAGARAILFDNYYIGFAARLCHSDYNALSSLKIDLSIKNPLDAAIVVGLCVGQGGNEFYPTLQDRLQGFNRGFPSLRYYSNGIKEIRNWLDQNPNEIVFVDFEEYVPLMGGPDEAVLAPIRAYLGDIVFTPPPPVPPASVTGSIATASFTGSITNGVLKVDALSSGALHVGDQINGASIPPGTFIQSFGNVSAKDGTGTYNLNQASLTVVPSEAIATVVLTVTAVSSGALHVDEQINGTGIPPGTFIQSFGKVNADGTGTYNLNQTSVTGLIKSGVLTVATDPGNSGALYATGGNGIPSDQITGTGIPAGTQIGCLLKSDGTCDDGNAGPFGGGDLLSLSNNNNTPLTDVPIETITTTLTVPSETITTTAPLSGRFPDRWPTRREMLAAGKRVIILDNDYFGNGGAGPESFHFAQPNQPAYPPLPAHTAPLPSEFLFSEREAVAGSYSDGSWLALNQRRYDPDPKNPKACFEHLGAEALTDFDVNFHKALFTKASIIVEERELGELLGFTVPLFPGAAFGLMSDRDIVDATKCNYGIITLDKYSIELHPPDGRNDGTLDYLLYETSPGAYTADSHRQALAVWSWKLNDRGQNGDCAMLEGSFSQLPSPSQPPLLSRRWVSADCTSNNQVQAKFACARPRSQSGKDPLQWQDPLGDDWKVTSAAGLWDAGTKACLDEFGSDGFVFSVPVNGYQNQRLKDADPANDNIWLNYRQHGDGKWVIPSSPAPVAIAGPNQVVECGNSVKLDAGGSSSPDGLTLSYKWQGPFGIRTTQVVNLATPGDLPLGVDPILLAVTDTNGQTGTDSLTVTVQDTTPPVIRSVVANPNSSWPPNHKMFPVHLSLDASDSCDPNFVCHVVSVTSNEGTSADWQIVGPADVMLRSERSGNGGDRVYTILIQCTDASGNSSTRAVTVTIPHDQGKSKP